MKKGVKSKRELLSEVVEHLSKKKKDLVKYYGSIQWCQHEKGSMWLPCVVVDPKYCKRLDELSLAKIVLGSKRLSVLVYWLGYDIITKYLVSNFVKFSGMNKGDPNDSLELTSKNVDFLERVKVQLEKLIDDAKKEKGTRLDEFVMKHHQKQNEENVVNKDEDEDNNNNSDEEDEDDDENDEDEEYMYTGEDGFEPKFINNTSLLDETELLKQNKQKMIGQDNIEDDDGGGYTEISDEEDYSDPGANDEDEDDEEDEDDDEEEYGRKKKRKLSSKKKPSTTTSTNKKAKRNSNDKKKLKEMKKKRRKQKYKNPVDLVSRIREKLSSYSELNEKGKEKQHIEKSLNLLKRLANVDMTKEILKQTEIGYVIVKLRKHKNEDIKKKADAIRKSWVANLKQ